MWGRPRPLSVNVAGPSAGIPETGGRQRWRSEESAGRAARSPPGRDRSGARGLAVARQRLATGDGVVDDRRWIVLADDAARLALRPIGHGPRLGQVLIRDVAQLGDVAAEWVPWDRSARGCASSPRGAAGHAVRAVEQAHGLGCARRQV